MKHLLAIFLALFLFNAGFAQYTHDLPADSVKIFSHSASGNGELIIVNGTRNKTGAFLRNRENGRTEFAYAVDSMWVSNDTVFVKRGNTITPYKVVSPIGQHIREITQLQISNWDSAYKNGSFDTTTRVLTLFRNNGDSSSFIIPRGGSTGASGIQALSSNVSGNTVTVSGDNGASTEFNLLTSNVYEGSNLYFTIERTRSSLSAGYGLHYDEGSGQFKVDTTLVGKTGPAGANGINGDDGQEVEIRKTSTYIQWRYVGDATWINLVALADITGPTGATGAAGSNGTNGTNGREVEIQKTSTYIQWRYVGDATWINLVSLADITGPTGATGAAGTNGTNGTNGREVEIQKTSTYIQWRYVGDATWINLVSLADITGPTGATGATGAAGSDGTNGTNGREVEIQKTSTYIQWRYVGDATWINLVSLTDITGPQGPQGIPGEIPDTSNLVHKTGTETITGHKIIKNNLTLSGNLLLEQVAIPVAPVTSIVNEAGNLNGSYLYQVTYVTADGETEGGNNSTSPVNPVNQKVSISVPTSGDPRVIARKIYRNGSYPDNVVKQLVATINDNFILTYIDNVADGSLGAYMPRVNTTGGIIYQNGQRVAVIDGSSTLVGINTMPLNTGYANSAFGVNALTANTIGYRNSAFGVFALYSNTTGYENTAVGVHALDQNTTGAANSAFGYGALIKNTTGSFNTATGDYALGQNTTASNNTASGFISMQMNTVGSNNAAFGYATLNKSNSYSNSAFGASALAELTTGNFNSAYGSGALTNNNGSFATAIGFNAANGGASHSNSVSIGAYAGAYGTEDWEFYLDGFNRETNARGKSESLLYGKFHYNDINQQFLNVNGHLYANAKALLTDSTSEVARTDWVKELLQQRGSGSSDFGTGVNNFVAKWDANGKLTNSSIADYPAGVEITKEVTVTGLGGDMIRVNGTSNPSIAVSDGTITAIMQPITTLGTWLGNRSNHDVYLVSNNQRKVTLNTSNSFQPYTDLEMTLGDGTHRWRRLFVDTVDASTYLNLPADPLNIVSASFSGTSTKWLKLTKANGDSIVTSFNDDNGGGGVGTESDPLSLHTDGGTVTGAVNFLSTVNIGGYNNPKVLAIEGQIESKALGSTVAVIKHFSYDGNNGGWIFQYKNNGTLYDGLTLDNSGNLIAPSLSGTGVRMVVASAPGVMGTQEIPSYSFISSLVNSSGNVSLVNDQSTPGNLKYYGTNSSGTKGYFDLPSGGSSYTLPIASATTLGGIKVGSGLSIDVDGVLSASGGDNYWNPVGDGIYYNSYVGIDMADPQESLHVGGNGRFEAALPKVYFKDNVTTGQTPLGDVTHNLGVHYNNNVAEPFWLATNVTMTSATAGNLGNTARGATAIGLSQNEIIFNYLGGGTNPRPAAKIFYMNHVGSGTDGILIGGRVQAGGGVSGGGQVGHVMIGAGTTGIAPIRIDPVSVLLTNPAPGAIETDGTDLYWTNSAGVRKKITLQ